MFCASFGIDAGAPEGDIVCTESEDTLYLDAKTAKGTALLDSLNTLTEEADGEADAAEMKAVYDTVSARIKKLPLAGLKPDAFGAGKTDEFSMHPSGKNFRHIASAAARAHLFVRPANATIFGISTRVTV